MPTAGWEATVDIPPPGRVQSHPYREVAEGGEDNGDVLKVNVGVVDQWDVLILVIVDIVID